MYIILQMLMSVTEGWMNATRMQLATTILEVMTAFAMWGSLEMDWHAQVHIHLSLDFGVWPYFNSLTTNDAYMRHDPCELSISLWEGKGLNILIMYVGCVYVYILDTVFYLYLSS